MIPHYLSPIWVAIAPALGNHVWQSTLFAITAGLFTLILRKNQARIRYSLWLAASMKFLIPFSLLVTLGSHLGWLRGPAGTNAGLYVAMEEVGQPFSQSATQIIPLAAPSTFSQLLALLLPALLGVWFFGFVVVVFVWCMRWRRVSAAIREAVAVREGRELEALRRLERLGGMQKQIDLLVSRTSLEPGIFGITHPVLIWPERISEHLKDAHLEAILAHEVWHVRRRDNLAAAMHMMVEAIFWFHPLVWWLGNRLLEERERACDEEVLESGSDRQIYAESILKICEFCVGSPLTCVSGVTGADLKKRIARIMTEDVARKLDLSRKLLLSAAGFLAVAAPVAFGLLHATQTRAASQAQITGTIPPVYEFLSIKPTSVTPDKSGRAMTRMLGSPNGFTDTNVTLRMLIDAAYKVDDSQVSGGPDWLNSERYDIEARIDKSVVDALEKLSPDQRGLERRRMAQALLADHFNLSLHREVKVLAVYELVVAKNGSKLQEAKPGDTYPNGIVGLDGRTGMHGIFFAGSGGPVTGQAVPISSLVDLLSPRLGGRVVVDKTGLTGNYDFTLHWTPDESEAPMFKGTGDGQQGTDNSAQPDSSRTSIFAALEEQLGLKLVSQQGPVEILVIDHAEKPSENSPAVQLPRVTGGRLAFDVASVSPSKSVDRDTNSNVPIGPEDVSPAGGLFSGTNGRLIAYIYFAYNLSGNQFQVLLPELPKWVISDRFDVDARAFGNPTKAQMRLMMQSLLADRFKLAIHSETRQLPVFALVLADPGKTGPQLTPHRDDSSCSTAPPPKNSDSPLATVAGGFPTLCGLIVGMPSSTPGRIRVAARKVPVGLLANTLAQMGNLDRAVLDQTGLSGPFDFTFEWTAQHNGSLPVVQPEEPKPMFLADLKEQLGLTFVSQMGLVDVFVLDHIDHLSEN